MERSRRIVLFLSATILVIALFTRGHRPSYDDGKVAFLHSGSTEITVRVKGPGPSSCVYSLENGAMVKDVIFLTACPSAPYMTEKGLLERVLQNGDIVELSVDDQQHLFVITRRMKATEEMLLGIPLDPDEMDLDDWESLPGIGPVLAQRIIDYRQKNGAFGPIEAVMRVPGVGEKKFLQMKRYFN